jgi:hypothetical protein
VFLVTKCDVSWNRALCSSLPAVLATSVLATAVARVVTWVVALVSRGTDSSPVTLVPGRGSHVSQPSSRDRVLVPQLAAYATFYASAVARVAQPATSGTAVLARGVGRSKRTRGNLTRGPRCAKWKASRKCQITQDPKTRKSNGSHPLVFGSRAELPIITSSPTAYFLPGCGLSVVSRRTHVP